METVRPPRVPIGRLEAASQRLIEGWVAIEADRGDPPVTPVGPVWLDIIIDGEVYGQIAATNPRPDIPHPSAAGFRLYMPAGLMPLDRHTVSIRFAANGPELTGSPREIPAAADPSVILHTITDAVAALTDAGQRDKAVEVIARSGLLSPSHRSSSAPQAPAPQAAAMSAEALQADRWCAADFSRVGTNDPAARSRIALVIDDRAPDTNRDAGSRAILSHMQGLIRLGYQVAFIPSQTLSLETSAKDLADAGIIPFSLPWVASVEEVLRRIGNRLAVAYVHRHTNLARYAALVRHLAPGARLVCCVADLHFVRLDRQARVEGDDGLARRIPELRTTELATLAMADAVVTHSPVEAGLLAERLPSSMVHTVPWHVAPWPIDVPLQQRRGVAFVGSFGHAPNRDAAEVLVNQIMPLVHARDPTVDCLLVGSMMPGSIASLARPGIIPLDTVADMRQIWGRVRLTVAPLRYGAGLKGKILDSAAAGIPFVASPTAVEGMDLPPALAAVISDDPATLAGAIIKLHWDQQANQHAAAEGLAWISRAYSRTVIDQALARAVCPPPIKA